MGNLRFLWDIHHIGGLPIFRKFYEEYTPFNDIFYSQHTSATCRALFNIYANDRKSKKFDAWPFHFIESSSTPPGFKQKQNISGEVYLVGFSAS